MLRRGFSLLFILGLLASLLAACAPATTSLQTGQVTVIEATPQAPAAKVEVRIGYQRGGAWTVLKAQGVLEKVLGPDVTVTWTLFAAGPQLLEAMNAGGIDIGPTGETPPIFAQAAGTPLVYVATQTGNGAGSGILVPEDSPIQTGQDLKGKKIVFQKASSAHLLLIKALEQQGLQYSDIEPVFLAPPEARAAFEGGSIDAWVVWNPFREAAIQELKAREVINGGAVAETRGYILAKDTFAAEHPTIVTQIIKELQTVQLWSKEHVEEYAALLEKETEIPASIWVASFDRETPEYSLMDQAAVTHQQGVADIFFTLELIPEPLTIEKAVWFAPAQ